MRFDPDTRARLRRGLMRRGQTLATILAELLAGKDKRGALAVLGVEARPGMRPDELVRAALEAVEARRRLLDAEDDGFGRCETCGDDLGLPALGEMPWADRCRAHAS
jgi:hypothetical protein